MKYDCEVCSYSTDIKFAYERHLTSQKHVRKMAEKEKELANTSRMHHVSINNNTKKLYNCQFCNNTFANAVDTLPTKVGRFLILYNEYIMFFIIFAFYRHFLFHTIYSYY